jgi:hypothetical protein
MGTSVSPWATVHPSASTGDHRFTPERENDSFRFLKARMISIGLPRRTPTERTIRAISTATLSPPPPAPRPCHAPLRPSHTETTASRTSEL